MKLKILRYSHFPLLRFHITQFPSDNTTMSVMIGALPLVSSPSNIKVKSVLFRVNIESNNLVNLGTACFFYCFLGLCSYTYFL